MYNFNLFHFVSYKVDLTLNVLVSDLSAFTTHMNTVAVFFFHIKSRKTVTTHPLGRGGTGDTTSSI